MIKIGDETLDDNGVATFNGTTLDQIIYNGTTVYQKKYPAMVSGIGSFKPNEDDPTNNGYYNPTSKRFTGTLTGVSFTIPAGERPFDRTVSLGLTLNIRAVSAIDDYSRTAVYEGELIVGLGSVTIPAGNGAYIVTFPDVTETTTGLPSYWETGTGPEEPQAEMKIISAVGIIMRDDKVITQNIPWSLGWTFTY